MPPAGGASEVDLDHVAHAVVHWRDIWDRYAVDLGAQWVSGGWSRGFAPGQLRFGNGARLEMLMPWDVEYDDFLARFLARHGPGAHHLTFKVPDIRAALRDAERAGFEPLGVDLSDPEWMEAFLHPKQASGVVVQLAESSIQGEGSGEWSTPPPDGFPTGQRRVASSDRPVAPGALAWVVHAVADGDAARSLFVGLLAGTPLEEGVADGVGWAAVSWGGPLRLRLLWPVGLHPAYGARRRGDETAQSPAHRLEEWLGGRAGRVHHLELEVEDPAGVPDSSPATDPLTAVGAAADEPRWAVPARANHGLALVLREAVPSPKRRRGARPERGDPGR